MDNKENILLAKIKTCLENMNDIETMILNNPNDQSNIDYTLSDYLHIIQTKNENLSISSKLKLIDDIEKARLQREQYNSIYLIGKYYNENKQNLLYFKGRERFQDGLTKLLQTLHQPYNYRVISNDYIDSLSSNDDNECEHKKGKLDKDTMKSLLNEGKKLKEIAEMYNLTQSWVSVLKKRYGLSKKKKGE